MRCNITGVPICPVLPRDVLVSQENFFQDALMPHFLIWYISHSLNCNNASCLHPTSMVSEFKVCYLLLCICVCENSSGICLVMLAVLWKLQHISGDKQHIL